MRAHLCIWACVYKCWQWIYICSAELGLEARTGSGTAFSFLWLAALLWRGRIKCRRLGLWRRAWAFFLLLPSCRLSLPPPLHLLSVLPLRAAQWRALKSQKNFFFFLPPCNLDKAWRFNESVWKEKWSLVSNPSSVCVSIRQFNPD